MAIDVFFLFGSAKFEGATHFLYRRGLAHKLTKTHIREMGRWVHFCVKAPNLKAKLAVIGDGAALGRWSRDFSRTFSNFLIFIFFNFISG